MRKRSRRFLQILQELDKKILYSPEDALNFLKKISSVNFIETLEAHISLGLDPKHADQQLRSTVILPKGSGKLVRVAVITQGDKIIEAQSVGADIIGSEDLIEEILNGRLDFDKLIVTPDMMLLIAKLGRILGPRGLMPSPKSGTVTNEIKQTITEFKSGKLEYKVDRTGIIHVPFGKLNFEVSDLYLNLKALQESIDKNRPSGSKGKYWKSLYLSSTMGPGIPVNINLLRETKIG
uniref:Large ribosomal subunit protein uL1c n=1 Tax=Ophidocladus simpliciusculus TaxID=1261574 RepID=A0A1Z1MJ26_9FLOR|nr:ribosomal protein L1 [Ophidocladus simpliciusculus]ARW66077.1 ribosomal protein L1 [Ophidocladus simpliciusculus]